MVQTPACVALMLLSLRRKKRKKKKTKKLQISAIQANDMHMYRKRFVLGYDIESLGNLSPAFRKKKKHSAFIFKGRMQQKPSRTCRSLKIQHYMHRKVWQQITQRCVGTSRKNGILSSNLKTDTAFCIDVTYSLNAS